MLDGLLFADVDLELFLLGGAGGTSSRVWLNLLTSACSDVCRPLGKYTDEFALPPDPGALSESGDGVE